MRLERRFVRVYAGDPVYRALAGGSAGWCHGEDVNHRRRHFRNLCLAARTDEFVFLHGPESTLEGCCLFEHCTALHCRLCRCPPVCCCLYFFP
jgi:hypothetical protein